MRKVFFVLIISSFFFKVFPQEDTLRNELEDLDELIESSTQEEDGEELINFLEELTSDPINLNTATVNDLLRIPFLTAPTALKIIQYRQINSHIFSVLELLTINGIDKEEILKSQKFLTVETKVTRKTNTESKPLPISMFDIGFRSRVISKIEKDQGQSGNKYLGNNLKIYNRAKMNYNDQLRIGILTEKDAGEKNFTDFVSFNALLENAGPFRKILVGDYNIEFGQGLALWAPYGFSKGGNTVSSVYKSDRIIKPYLSANENQFFRGIAATSTYNLLTVTGFYSSNQLDASIDTVSNKITSLVQTGYHRTENEILKKNKANEKIIGSIVNLDLTKAIGMEFLYYRSIFDKSFADDFNGGSKFNCFAASYKAGFNNIIFFGETAWNNAFATFNSIELTLNENISTCFSYRNYSADYYNLHAFGFGENSGQTRNEVGFYTGVNIKSKYGRINFYYDQFKFPSSTYSNLLPTLGREFYIEYSKKIFNRTEILFRYKNEKKQLTINSNEAEIISGRLIQKIKFEIKYQISSSLRLKTRIDYVHYYVENFPVEDGYFLLQDFNYRPISKLNIYARVVFFETDSYNTRLYEYENDLDGVLTNALVYGKGFRWYFLVKYKLFDILELSLKYREHFKLADQYFSDRNYALDNNISLQMELIF